MRSMPTSDTRTHASMTMPLSSTRSRTSIRLDPPAARSTAILIHLLSAIQALGAQARRAGGGAGRGFQLALQPADLIAQRLVFGGKRFIAYRQMAVVLPPVEADLLRLVDRTDQQPDADGQQLHFRDGNFDVAGDDEAFVEDAIEHVDQATAAAVADLKPWIVRHKQTSTKERVYQARALTRDRLRASSSRLWALSARDT